MLEPRKKTKLEAELELLNKATPEQLAALSAIYSARQTVAFEEISENLSDLADLVYAYLKHLNIELDDE